MKGSSMERETVGKLATDLLQKEPETRSPIELEQAMQQDYCNELIACVQQHKASYPGDFYIVVITKRERLMQNVLRNYFTARASCPTPDYDQSVYKYKHADEAIEYLWTIPDREVCHHLLQNALYVVPSERQLLTFVVEFADGTLFKRAKQLNNEVEDSPLLAS